MENKLDIPYMIRVLVEIYGREHGLDITANITPKDLKPQPKPDI